MTQSTAAGRPPDGAPALRLYASIACPYSHRVIAALDLTGQADRLPVSWMATIKREGGWRLEAGPDPVFARVWLADIYAAAGAAPALRPSVPLLVDVRSARFLSNESAAIVRMVTTGIGGPSRPRVDLAPLDLRPAIDAMNRWLHHGICQAVYRVGFATTQERHDHEAQALFAALDQVEALLARQDWLVGGALTESDLFLFATMLRFERIYAPLFRCLYRPVSDYPAILAHLRRMLAIPALAARHDPALLMRHYFGSLLHTVEGVRDLNPGQVIPAVDTAPRPAPGSAVGPAPVFTGGAGCAHQHMVHTPA